MKLDGFLVKAALQTLFYKLLTVRDALISWGIDLIFNAVVWWRTKRVGVSHFPFSLADLRAFPQGSLGRATAELLDSRGLVFIPNYETHDLRHILYDFPMNLEGEVRMMAFQAGCKAGWKNVFVWICLFVAVPTMPERWRKIRQSYQRGAALKSIDMKPNFLELLPLPLHEARARVGLEFTLF